MKKTFKEYVKSNLIHSFYKELDSNEIKKIMNHQKIKPEQNKFLEKQPMVYVNKVSDKNDYSLTKLKDEYETFKITGTDRIYFDRIIIEEID